MKVVKILAMDQQVEHIVALAYKMKLLFKVCLTKNGAERSLSLKYQ